MNNKIRKIILPINIKLTGFVLILTGLALALYVWIALDLFKTDKIAYVFESVEQKNEQMSQSLSYYLNSVELSHKLLSESSYTKDLLEVIFEKNPSLLVYLEYRNGKKYLELKKNDSAESINIDVKKINQKFEIVKNKEHRFLVHKISSGQRLSYSITSIDKLMSLIPTSNLYQHHLVLNDEVIIGSEVLDSNLSENVSKYSYQTKVLGDVGKRNIVSIYPVLDRQWFLITSIPYDKALSASTTLRNKSLYFGFFVAGIVILSILFFSRFITAPIKKLYLASIELSNKNFSFRTNLKERDEIGVLGDSFNFMAQEIERYMEEMKEKARLENELKTAQLVQKSFFPTDSISGPSLALKAYYKPASECGGDWWGYLKTAQSEIVILLDVTGHGTAAALVTAVTHNALTALEYLIERDDKFAKSPEKIMEYLNKSLCSMDINLNATAFVLVISDGQITYTNASHNPPYYIQFNESGNYEKNNFQPLMEAQGVRLGESTKSVYTSSSFTFNDKDNLILYTDGILEAENMNNKAYGTRRFIKSLSENLNLSANEVITKNIETFNDFLDGASPNDDITLINLKLKK